MREFIRHRHSDVDVENSEKIGCKTTFEKDVRSFMESQSENIECVTII